MTQQQAERRSEILELIDKKLDTKELEKLGQIVQSDTAREYISNPIKWAGLKFMLKI